jgi:hypothetical protein
MTISACGNRVVTSSLLKIASHLEASMNIIKKLIIATGLITLVILNSSTFAASRQFNRNLGDPFIGTWVDNDGVNTYSMKISPSEFSGQTYRVEYELPGTRIVSSRCNPISTISLKCADLWTTLFTRNDADHSLVVDTSEFSSGSFVFYDQEHMPNLPSYLGRWQAEYQGYSRTTIYTIDIMAGPSDNQVRVLGSFSDSRKIYQITNNPDGTKVFSYGSSGWDSRVYSFMLDTRTNQVKSILKKDPNDISQMEPCIYVPDYDQLVFNKNVNAH